MASGLGLAAMIFCLVFSLPVLFGFLRSFRSFARASRSAGWERLPANIVESRIDGKAGAPVPRIVFEYAILGRRRIGDRVFVDRTWQPADGDGAALVAAHPVGSSTSVAVSGWDSGYAVLMPGLRRTHWRMLRTAFAWLAGWCALFVAGALLLGPSASS